MLNLKPLEQIGITLLPRMLRLNINNHLLMPVASRRNTIREIVRPTNQTRRSHLFRLNLLVLSIQNLVDVENGQEMGNSQEQTLVRNVSTRADTATEAKDIAGWIGLVPRGKVSIRIECQGVRIGLGIVRKPPD
jgi:hypothetical protein